MNFHQLSPLTVAPKKWCCWPTASPTNTSKIGALLAMCRTGLRWVAREVGDVGRFGCLVIWWIFPEMETHDFSLQLFVSLWKNFNFHVICRWNFHKRNSGCNVSCFSLSFQSCPASAAGFGWGDGSEIDMENWMAKMAENPTNRHHFLWDVWFICSWMVFQFFVSERFVWIWNATLNLTKTITIGGIKKSTGKNLPWSSFQVALWKVPWVPQSQQWAWGTPSWGFAASCACATRSLRFNGGMDR